MVVMEENLYSDRITLEELASRMATNRTYMSRAMSSSGCRFTHFMNLMRLKAAFSLLKEKDRYGNFRYSVGDAAIQSGFSSERNFYRFVRKVTGRTPAELRELDSLECSD